MEDKVDKNTQAEQQKEKRILKNEENFRNILNSMKEDTESIKKERVINKECNI